MTDEAISLSNGDDTGFFLYDNLHAVACLFAIVVLPALLRIRLMYTVCWLLFTVVSHVTSSKAALGIATTMGITVMVGWYTLRIFDRYAFTALLNGWLGVWATSPALGCIARIGDILVHLVTPMILIAMYLPLVQVWMSFPALICSRIWCYVVVGGGAFPKADDVYRFSPPRSQHFWTAAYKMELLLNLCVPLFCVLAHQRSFWVYVVTAVCGGTLCTLQLLRSLLLPKLRRNAKKIMARLLLRGGIHPSADFIVHNDSIYLDWMSDGLVAIGESYVAGLWEVNNNKTLDEVIALILNIPMDARQEMYRSWNARLVALAARTFNYASASKGLIVGSASEQFDLGAEFRREYMDKSFHHGFGVWTDGVRTLDDAQDRKLSSLSTKLDLNISTPQPTVRLLDVCVGSWGGVGCFLTARNASTIGQTTCILTSHQELIHAEKSAEELGVKSKMKFIIAENSGKLIFMLSLLERDSFDRVVCCNFLEALQRPQQHAVFQHFRRILKYSGGQVVMDFVTCSAIRTTLHTWNNKYIHGSFGFNPLSLSQVRSLAQVHGFYIEEIVAYTDHYEQTYLAWHRRFKSRWNDIEQSDPLQQVRPRQDESLTLTSRNPSLPESFKRTWEFYLLHSAAAFRARAMQVYQMKLVGQ